MNHARSAARLLLAALAAMLLLAATPAAAQTTTPDRVPEGLTTIVVRPSSYDALTKIAVPDTYNLGETDPRGLQLSMAKTIRTCLGIAGFFNVLSPDRYFFDSSREGITAPSTNFTNWYNVGAQFVVKAAFKVATNQARVEIKLFDVNTQKEVDIGFKSTTVGLDAVEPEVYRFINLLMKYFTGNEGLFGTRIAYVARTRGSKQVFVTGIDGAHVEPISSVGPINILPAWNGSQLVYTSFASGNPDLVTGGKSTRTLSGQPGLNSGASVRPGTGEIALTLTRDGNAEIYILNPATDTLRRCTNNAAEDVSASWSPDGSRIAFVSDRSGGPQVFVMNADCTGERRLTFRGSYNTTPDWSPRGDLIAFTGRDGVRQDIFTVEVDSGFIERLTQDQGDNEEPSWSPDGQFLVFSSSRGGKKKLYIMPASGFPQTEIPLVGSGFEQPAWQR